MSASSKKKLRKEQAAGQMTERQIKEQKEAKNLKIMTAVFVTVVALALVIAITVSAVKIVARTGVIERNTIALTIGDTQLNSAELTYYYVDAVNNFYNNFYDSYGSYASTYAMLLYGLDFSSSLGDQVKDSESGDTWADYFIDTAIQNAVTTHALNIAAGEAEYALTEDQLKSIDSYFSSLSIYASLYGYDDVESYLKAMYGFGTTLESYKEYYTQNQLASAYQSQYYSDLTYTADDISAKDNEDLKAYNSYSYSIYTLYASKFYGSDATDEEKAEGLKQAEEAANSLLGGTTLEEFNTAIKALEINKESTSAAASEYADTLYSNVGTNVGTAVKDWVTAEERTEGEMTVLPITSTSTAEDGTETTTTNGYYIVLFQGMEDNTFTLPSVRHILVAFEGGTYDSTTGTTTYSDDEKATAKLKAEQLYEEWKSGKANELTFETLANEESDDGDGTTGGLCEDIYPGQMVTSFEEWVYDETRQPGDTGIIESDYGYHIMYYVSDGDTTYRDYMIENDLRYDEWLEWLEALVDATEYTEGNLSKLNKDLTISG